MPRKGPMPAANIEVPKSINDLHAAYLRDKCICQYCGADGLRDVNTYYTLRLDHFTPRAKDGGDNSENLVTACHPCNAFKGSREFSTIKEAQKYIDWRRKQAEEEVRKVREAVNAFP